VKFLVEFPSDRGKLIRVYGLILRPYQGSMREHKISRIKGWKPGMLPRAIAISGWRVAVEK